MKILIAEDDNLSRMMLEKTLRHAGYEVIAVADGESARKELAKEDAPRLALLDWLIPGKDGVSVCREMRGGAEKIRRRWLRSSGHSKPLQTRER